MSPPSILSAAICERTPPVAYHFCACGCLSPQNPIEAENCLAGNPQSQWDIGGAGDPSIQDFATEISVNEGQNKSPSKSIRMQ
jgi:hypothetical protein